MTLSTTQGMDSSEDRVRLLMKETIEFLRSHAFIFNFSNIKMVKDKILDQVPSDWKNFMKTTDLLTFKECFYEGSSVATSSLAPQTFVTFVRERNRLMDLVDRETLESSQESDDLHNNPKLTKGMCPKKHHEVSRMTRFLASRRSSSGPDVVVDVGSGLGYLGRSLTQAGFRVVGLERDSGHSENARKRTSTKSEDHLHQMETLTLDVVDSEESRRHLDEMISSIADDYWTVGLHACGDLTPAILKWFIQSKSTSLFLVSCCYHKMTQRAFPMSDYCKQNVQKDDPLRSHFALRLASQEHFQKWVQTSVTDHDKRSRYLGYRCLLEAMEGVSGVKKVRRRALRKGQMETFQDFIDNALERFDFELSGDGEESESKLKIRRELQSLYEQNEPDFLLFEMITGLQAFLQQLLEIVVLLDRKLFLCENGISAQVVQTFDPLISPRCFSTQCTKL